MQSRIATQQRLMVLASKEVDGSARTSRQQQAPESAARFKDVLTPLEHYIQSVERLLTTCKSAKERFPRDVSPTLHGNIAKLEAKREALRNAYDTLDETGGLLAWRDASWELEE